jgi:hypothetical protein
VIPKKTVEFGFMKAWLHVPRTGWGPRILDLLIDVEVFEKARDRHDVSFVF